MIKDKYRQVYKEALTLLCCGLALITPLTKASDGLPTYLEEKKLSYQINLKALQQGNFQYYFSLLNPKKLTRGPRAEKYNIINSVTGGIAQKEVLETFMPLDIYKLWDPSEGNHLAVTKLNYILPVDIENITEERLISKDYLQKTVPDYTVSDRGDYFHIEGSLLTPEFELRIRQLTVDDTELQNIRNIDREKIRSEKMKVFIQHQDNFGKVLMFKTAKMSCTATVYEEISSHQVLVTQYILSNVINVPTKSLMRKEMIKNMRKMVKGSREAVVRL